MPHSPAPAFRWRSIVVGAYLPTLLFSIGEGAIIPVIPTVADDLGASLALAGLVATAILVGELLGDVPSGLVVAKVGERAAMIGAAALAIVGAVLALLARDPLVLGAAMLVVGLASSTFALARHAFLTVAVPLRLRARALSTLGGVRRAGFVVGPFVTAGVIQLTGAPALAFAVLIAGAAVTIVALLVLRDPAESAPVDLRTAELATSPAPSEGVFRSWRRYAAVLGSVGVGGALLSALRASRQVILPLWAVSIGVPDATTALIIALGGLVDLALFYPGGWIMDRFGRMWVAVPAVGGLGLWLILLGASHDLPGATAWFVVVTVLLALTNGPSAGIMLTLGADLADRRNPAPFLGAWRLTADLGSASVPLLLAGVTAIASLPIAAITVGALGFVGAGILRVSLPKHLPPHALRPARAGATEPAPGPAALAPTEPAPPLD